MIIDLAEERKKRESEVYVTLEDGINPTYVLDKSLIYEHSEEVKPEWFGAKNDD